MTLILLLDRLEDIEHARFRALAQLVVDKEAGVKAFEDYMTVAFPSLTKRNKRRDDDIKKQLKDWVSTGPLDVKPLDDGARRKAPKNVAVLRKGEDGVYNEVRNRFR